MMLEILVVIVTVIRVIVAFCNSTDDAITSFLLLLLVVVVMLRQLSVQTIIMPADNVNNGNGDGDDDRAEKEGWMYFIITLGKINLGYQSYLLSFDVNPFMNIFTWRMIH